MWSITRTILQCLAVTDPGVVKNVALHTSRNRFFLPYAFGQKFPLFILSLLSILTLLLVHVRRFLCLLIVMSYPPFSLCDGMCTGTCIVC